MINATHTVDIDCPAEKVYDFLLDGMNSQLWRTTITDVQRIAGKEHSYKMGMKGPGGRNDADYEVVEQKPHELIVMKGIAGMVRPTGTFALESVGSLTRVTYSMQFDGRGPARLMEPLAEPIMRKEVGMLDNLKLYLEDGTTTSDVTDSESAS